MATTYPLQWDQTGEKKYENGISKGVLYKKDQTTGKWLGVPWNGLTSVTESPEGADKTDLWADNIKYASMRAAETFGGTIEAYTYPEEFESCDGSASIDGGKIAVGQQPREMFRLCYRTEQGNDTDGANYGYKLHLVYGCTCSPSEKAYETINDSPDAVTFSWEFDTTPVAVEGMKQTSLLVIDSTKFATSAEQAKLAAIEEVLYGKAATTSPSAAAVPAELPDPDDIIDLLD
jgi:hypothetical protein